MALLVRLQLLEDDHPPDETPDEIQFQHWTDSELRERHDVSNEGIRTIDTIELQFFFFFWEGYFIIIYYCFGYFIIAYP